MVISARQSGCGFSSRISAGLGRLGGLLRHLHRVQQRVQHIERHHYENGRERIGALQLPSHAGGVCRNLLVALLRIDAIGFDVLFEADVADGIRIGISIGKMRPVAESGSMKITSASTSKPVRTASVNGSQGSTGT